MRPVWIALLIGVACSRPSHRRRPSVPEPVKGCSTDWLDRMGKNLALQYGMPPSTQVIFKPEIRNYDDVQDALGVYSGKLHTSLGTKKFCTLYLGRELLPGQIERDQIVFIDPRSHTVIDHIRGP